jgi:hypothetical protein
MKNIQSLHVSKDKIINDPDPILKEERRFYETLYTKLNTSTITGKQEAGNYFLNQAGIPKIKAEDKTKLKIDISDLEIAKCT